MPNSRVLFSRMIGQLQNLQKFCPTKLCHYMVYSGLISVAGSVDIHY